MAAAQLVGSEIEAGLALVRVLDALDFGVRAALWLYNGETENWRFVIGVDGDREELSRQYYKAAFALAEWRKAHPEHPDLLDLARVKFVLMSDPLITGLARLVQSPTLGSKRLTSNVVNGVYVEDALVHRIAA